MRRIRDSADSKIKLNLKVTAIKQLMQLHEDKVIDGDDWRSAYRLPELFGALERKKSDMLENLTEVTFKSTLAGDYDMAVPSRAIVDHFDLQSDRKTALVDAISNAVDYGTGIEKHTVALVENDYVETDDHSLFLEHKDPEKRVSYYGLAPTTVDIRDAFPDPTANVDHDPHGNRGMDWFYERKIYSWEQFQRDFGDKERFDIEDIHPVNWGGVEHLGIERMSHKHEFEEKENAKSQYVVVFEGWDCVNDWHVFVANGKEIYFGAIPFKHKRIPVSFRYNYKRDDSIWGISETEVQAPFVMVKEVLVNLMIDNAKLSQQPVLAVSGDVLFDPDENQLEPGALFTLRGLNGGKIGDAIQPLTFGSSVEPANAVKNILEDLQIQVTGDDSRALFVQPNELATQTLAKQESMKRRIRKNVLQNTIRAEKNSLYQRFMNICQFMAKPYEGVDGKLTYHTIPIEDFHVSQRNATHQPEFTPARGYTGYFKLNDKVVEPNYIMFDIVEKVEDTVRKEQELQSLQWYLQILFSTAQVSPELLASTDFEMLAKQAGKRFTDIDVDAIFNSAGRIVDGMDEMDYHVQQIALGIKPTISRDGNNMRRLHKYRLFAKSKEYAILPKAQKGIFAKTLEDIIYAIRDEKSLPFGQQPDKGGMATPGATGQQGPVQGGPETGGGTVSRQPAATGAEAQAAQPVRGGEAGGEAGAA